MYNINEIIFKLKDGLLNQLRDCSSEQKSESFSMTQCAADWIKKELPNDFPSTNKILGFSSLAKLVSTVGGDYENYEVSDKTLELFLTDVKRLTAADKCIVDEPYEPPINRKNLPRPSLFSLGLPGGLQIGLRAGINGINASLGMQLGLVLDIAVSDIFYIQPGLMYVQNPRKHDMGYITNRYLELPLLLSLKLSAFRLNAGPYVDLPIITSEEGFDIGLSAGIGLDIWMFYIGAFYDTSIYDHFGFNVGVNL